MKSSDKKLKTSEKVHKKWQTNLKKTKTCEKKWQKWQISIKKQKTKIDKL